MVHQRIHPQSRLIMYVVSNIAVMSAVSAHTTTDLCYSNTHTASHRPHLRAPRKIPCDTFRMNPWDREGNASRVHHAKNKTHTLIAALSIINTIAMRKCSVAENIDNSLLF